MSKFAEWSKVHRTVLLQVGGIFLALLIASIGFAAGMSFQSRAQETDGDDQVFNREVGSYKYISPLLDCGYPSEKSSLEIKTAIESRIAKEKAAGHVNHVSVYFRDLNNGPWVGVDSRELFSPASLMKVPLLIAYLRWEEEEPGVLAQKIVYQNPVETLEQNIVGQTELQLHSEYRVDQLLELMITESNNVALSLLSDHIGVRFLDETYKKLGVNLAGIDKNPTGDSISVVQYATFFRVLFNASYLSSQMSEKALSILTKTKFMDGIKAGLPDSIEVAHKFGERQFTNTGEKQLHDCGIVYVPEKPYLLCVMTRGNDFAAMAQTISGISADIYKVFAE